MTPMDETEIRDDEPEFTPGDTATWIGNKGLFERPVTITGARRGGLLIFGETPGTGPWIYDIHDAEVIKGTIFAIPGRQLRKEAGDGQ